MLKKYECDERLYDESVVDFLKKKGDNDFVNSESVKFFNYIKSKSKLNSICNEYAKINEVLQEKEKENLDNQNRNNELKIFL